MLPYRPVYIELFEVCPFCGLKDSSSSSSNWKTEFLRLLVKFVPALAPFGWVRVKLNCRWNETWLCDLLPPFLLIKFDINPLFIFYLGFNVFFLLLLFNFKSVLKNKFSDIIALGTTSTLLSSSGASSLAKKALCYLGTPSSSLMSDMSLIDWGYNLVDL